MIRLALLIILFASPAWAHGDADWIRKGGYANPADPRQFCCGRVDCVEIAAERVHEGPDGYKLDDYGETVPHKLSTPSEDGKYWRCQWGGERKCFFYPLTGF